MASATKTAQPGNTYLHQWALTTADPTGDGVTLPGAPDRCFQMVGDPSGGTLKFQGSLDGGTTWFDLHDPTYVSIGLTAAGGGAILENPLLIRPALTGSTGAAVTVYLFSRSPR